MSDYTIDYDAVQDPELRVVAAALRGFPTLDSETTFNTVCHTAVETWEASGTSPLSYTEFATVRENIRQKHGQIIQTGWGGVDIRVHEHPHVEKYLAVDRGTWLAFEKHELKEEELQVREGRGLLIYRKDETAPLQLKLLKPGVRVELPPGHEHAVIALEDLLIYEVSEDHKGMDQDLIFIYLPN